MIREGGYVFLPYFDMEKSAGTKDNIDNEDKENLENPVARMEKNILTTKEGSDYEEDPYDSESSKESSEESNYEKD